MDPATKNSSSFAPTRWTLVLQARGHTPEARAALGALCEAYWQPVFRFLRRSGREEDSARELTQEFCARLLAGDPLSAVDPRRGRFRSFLLGALKHFLADLQDRQSRLKRGGGVTLESIHPRTDTRTTSVVEPADPAAMPADEVFDRQWALAVIERALRQLEDEMAGAGRGEQFELLKPWLEGEAAGVSQAEAAQRMGLSEGAFKVSIHRLRKRFRQLVREEVAQTVNDPADVQEELKYLVEVLAHSQ